MVLIVQGMISCVASIVEHANVVVRHHIVEETNVYVLLTAVAIAQARIHSVRCDLRPADTASMLMDLSAIVSEHPQTGAPKLTTPNGRPNREPRAFMPPLPCCDCGCWPLIISRCMTLVWTRKLATQNACLVFQGTDMGGQRQSSFIRQQREMARKLKAAEKRAKRQSRASEKPKDGTEGHRDRTDR